MSCLDKQCLIELLSFDFAKNSFKNLKINQIEILEIDFYCLLLFCVHHFISTSIFSYSYDDCCYYP